MTTSHDVQGTLTHYMYAQQGHVFDCVGFYIGSEHWLFKVLPFVNLVPFKCM